MSSRISPCVTTIASVFYYFLPAKWVVHPAAYCPKEMKFHDNSKHSINRRALVQAEWWGGVKSNGALIKKKRSSSVSLQHSGIVDKCCTCLLLHTHACTQKCKLCKLRKNTWMLSTTRFHTCDATVEKKKTQNKTCCWVKPCGRRELDTMSGLKRTWRDVNGTTRSAVKWTRLPS